MAKKIKLAIIVLLIIFFFPKPCGTWTTAAVLKMETKCFGLKIWNFFSTGGGPYYCLGMNDLPKKPDFSCNNDNDCVSGCGWRGTYSGIRYEKENDGCVAVNKNSQDYLKRNKLKIMDSFPLVCYDNNCAFRVEISEKLQEKLGIKAGEVIVGFKEMKDSSVGPFILGPEETSPMPPWLLWE